MNLQLQHSLKWQMIGPIPLMVIVAIAAVWLTVPRMIADNATNQAVLAGRTMATQFKTLREYYTKVLSTRSSQGAHLRLRPITKGMPRRSPCRRR
jgi:hypothetical protein